MAKTVVGVMDTMQEAQSVIQDLVNSGFRRENISILTSDKEKQGLKGAEPQGKSQGEERAEGAAKGAGTGAALGGIAGLIVGLTGLAIPGIGPIIAAGPIAALLAGAGVGAVAGGAVGALTKMGVPERDAQCYAEAVKRGGFLVTVTTDDNSADQAAEIMRRHGAVDIDKRAEAWRKEGWTAVGEKAAPQPSAAREREGVIPVVEEEVRVGKRQVETGGVRVYSHITEKPVEEQVSLREEQARVKEEVTVGKQAAERTEQVRETVRRTDVEVEKTGQPGYAQKRPQAPLDDNEFQEHFSTTYGTRGERFESYRSAYHYAESRSSDPRFEGKEWPQVEEDIHQDWERSHPGTWAKVRDAIHYGWNKTHRH